MTTEHWGRAEHSVSETKRQRNTTWKEGSGLQGNFWVSFRSVVVLAAQGQAEAGSGEKGRRKHILVGDTQGTLVVGEGRKAKCFVPLAVFKMGTSLSLFLP